MENRLSMRSDNMFVYKSANSFILRSGVWNHIELVFERSEFEENKSDYDAFVALLSTLLNGEDVSKEKFKSDPYVKDIIEQLIKINIIVDGERSPVNITGKALYLVEDGYLEQANMLISSTANSEIKTIKTFEGIVSNAVIDRTNYLETESSFNKCSEELEEYSRIVLILSAPQPLLLKKLNRILLRENKPWSVAFMDGYFAVFASFNPNFTGCFECFEQHQTVRMLNMVSYLDFIRNVDRFEKIRLDKGTFNFLASFILQLEKPSLYAIPSTLEGKAISIYTPSFEITVEPLTRTSTCAACGHVGATISSNYNLSTKNALLEILNGDPNASL